MAVFLFVAGVFSVVSVVPLGYLALRSAQEARELRIVQGELATVMHEVKETGDEVRQLQHAIQRDQETATKTIEETKRTVEQTAEQVTEAVEQTVGQIAEATAQKEAA